MSSDQLKDLNGDKTILGWIIINKTVLDETILEDKNLFYHILLILKLLLLMHTFLIYGFNGHLFSQFSLHYQPPLPRPGRGGETFCQFEKET